MSDKIAIFLPSLRGGGAQRVAVDIANGLSRRGINIDLILASGEGVYHKLLDPSISVIDFDVKRVHQAIFPLIRYLNTQQPMTLFSIQRNAAVTAAIAIILARWNGNMVARETNSFVRVPGRDLSMQDRVIESLVKLFYRYMHSVIVPSKGIAAELDYLSNVIAIPNPVNILSVKTSKSVHERAFILGVGSLDRQKRFDDLISAFARLKNKFGISDIDLIILGEGVERPALVSLAQKLGVIDNLILPGFVDDPFSYMHLTSTFVLSSGWEGLPNVLIQAMACGAPVVATDCSHGPREILDNGQYGELVPVGNIEAMAVAIQQQLQKGRIPYPAEALSPYDLDRVINAYLPVLTGTLQ